MVDYDNSLRGDATTLRTFLRHAFGSRIVYEWGDPEQREK